MRHALTTVFALSFTLAGCPAPEADPNITSSLGRCLYVNSFSGDAECKEYLGSQWTTEAMLDNCAAPVPGSDPGLFEADLACDRSQILGECFVDAGTVESNTIVFLGDDAADCDGLPTGCSFAGGEFVPAATCGGVDPLPPADFVPFEPLRQVCVDPLPNEGPGQSEDGQVCTWEAISASTEPGRRYVDYASCEPIYTQRPYWTGEALADTPPDDPRLSDPEYQEELGWVTSEVEASACICCHSSEVAPRGPSGWFLEAEGIWVDTLDDDGLAMLAGWIDSTAFGAFEPEHNNGFSRELTGLPSSDPPRTRAFLEGELQRRGLTEADFADAEPFGGPLADQLAYEPGPCSGTNGVGSDGRVRWSGGAARYLYVLEAGATSPLVPPNLDLPTGTLWRLDVPPDGTPLNTGLTYADVPSGSAQAFPLVGAPAALVSGRTYYLYAARDVAQPLTRCLFTAP